MKIRMLMATALLLAGCASTSTNQGMVRRDGSWYSPATDGHGDYYTGSDRRYLAASPWGWSVGFTPYEGYCSVVYRYCTSFWDYSPWVSYGGVSPWAWAWVPPRMHRRPMREREFRSVFEDDDGIGAPPVGGSAPGDRTGADTSAGSRRPEGGWGSSHREGRVPHARRGSGGNAGGPD